MLMSGKIEYMVVSFDDEKKRALLSLRQTEILMKLQSVTLDPGLEKYKPKKWSVPNHPQPLKPPNFFSFLHPQKRTSGLQAEVTRTN